MIFSSKKNKPIKVIDPTQKVKITIMIVFALGATAFAVKVVSLLEEILVSFKTLT